MITLPRAAVAIVLIAATAGPASAAACDPGLRKTQQRLAFLGFPSGADDGCTGPATRAAVSAFQRAEGLTSDGVAGPLTRRALGAAVRPRPITKGRGHRFEVDLDRQLLLHVRGRRVLAVYAASTGARAFATPRGSFRVGRKEPRSWSVPYRVWLPWASYFAGGVAVHAGEVGVPRASHGCVRVPASQAQAIYRSMPPGTRVVVR